MKMIAVLSVLVVITAVIGTACRSASDKAAASSGSQKVLYYTCPMHPSVKSDTPGNCSICGMALTPVYAGQSATNDAPAATARLAPYPLDNCIVSGEKLGVMGEPVVFAYKGQEIKFCCPNCKPKFLQDPDGYLKKIQAAAKKIAP